MSQGPLVHKLKNYYSFGRDSIKSNQDRIVTGQSLNLRQEQSFSFDLQRDLDGLGMEIVNASQKDFHGSVKTEECVTIKKVKFQRFINFVKQSMIRIKFQAKKIKEQHENYFVHSVYNDFKKQFQQRISKEEQTSYKNVQQSLKSKFKYRNEQRKMKVLKKTENMQKVEMFPLVHNEIENSYVENDFVNEIKMLRNEIDCKTKEIFLLKTQLYAIKSLSDKKQSYFLEIIKVKEQQWDRKVKSMSGSNVNGNNLINYEVKLDCYSQNKQKRVVTEGCESLSQRLKNPMGNFLQNLHQKYESLDVEMEKGMKRYNSKMTNTHNSCSAFQKHQKQDQARIVQRAVKRRDRKKSTDFSFQRVSEKIKVFQSSIKR